ncbi:MAG TPA: class I SAM-dependent methyltransferase [Bryobacteraceae bacterium]|jgi:ubiquinone/menaquinone biosynthesis C-methylase UbiE|nr:class I SAM-dependent methyltransferase [Bryobacteraceae bacterium]
MDSTARKRFLADYTKIRHAEGRGSTDAAYYRELPYRDLSGNNAAQWRIRACSFRYFERKILRRMEGEARRPLRILDLGAGNGWMSWRLALRRHWVVALDIFQDERDGLGALSRYPVPLAGVAAEFDLLPFGDASFDAVIFNSSFHYSSNYVRTLREARRCLRPAGRLVIMDSPLYECSEHGEMMRAERHAQFENLYGFRSEAQQSIEYLDRQMLDELACELKIEWQIRRPWYGVHWALRPLRARLGGRRPPSNFVILTGRFRER